MISQLAELIIKDKAINSKRIKGKFRPMLEHVKLYINRRPRLRRFMIKLPLIRPLFNLFNRDVFVSKAHVFDDLKSIKIIKAMSESDSGSHGHTPVIFLQIK